MHLQSPTARRRSAVLHGRHDIVWSIVLAAAARLLLFNIQLTHHVHADCPPENGCGPYGRCIRGTFCSCNLGYDGDDCSIPIDICPGTVVPDGMVVPDALNIEDEKEAYSCLNGGQCVEQDAIDETTGEMKMEWRCDCSTAVGDAASSESSSSSSSFAGFRCEFPAETSCVVTDNSAKNIMSTYAFCVNGGKCLRMIQQGEPHPGCGGCPGFEGRHCQYVQGTAPAEELDFAQHQVHDSNNDVGMSGLAIFFVITLCLIFISIVGYLLFVNHTRTKARTASATTTTEGAVDDSSPRETSFKNESSTTAETAAAEAAVCMEAMEHEDLKLKEEEDTEKDNDESEPKKEII